MTNLSKQERLTLIQENMIIEQELRYQSNQSGKFRHLLTPRTALLTKPQFKYKTISNKLGEVILSGEEVITSLLTLRKLNPNSKIGVLNYEENGSLLTNYLNGNASREADLCLASNLHISLESAETSYSIQRVDTDAEDKPFILSSRITLFRTEQGELLDRPEVLDHVVTLPNLHLQSNQHPLNIYKRLKSQLEQSLQLFCDLGCDIIVLGDYGYTGTGIPNELLAKISKEVIETFKHSFNQIVFAIPKTQLNNRYEVYKSELNTLLSH